ncbi:hypothetical protein DLH72_04090 [Candidatus Gracilibacteria bacterium]|nr:MAG: hypothetical protein DLH72_04090 [Candidatus Gracilibacteria bacterium]
MDKVDYLPLFYILKILSFGGEGGMKKYPLFKGGQGGFFITKLLKKLKSNFFGKIIGLNG